MPPYAQSKEPQSGDPFIRPQPRGPLSKLNRLDQASESPSFVSNERMVVEETITTEYFAGAKIIHEVRIKTTETTKAVRRSESDDIQPILPMPVNENWGFEIHHDNVEDSDMADVADDRFEEITMEEENDDKENQEPGLGRSIDEMDWEEMAVPRLGKRKHFEDFV